MAGKIVVIGSSNVDFVMQVPSLPQVGETVTGGEFLQTFGGKGANTAVAAARTGPKTRTVFITALGDDLFAPAMLANFQRDNIDVSRVLIRKGVASGSALIMIDRDGRNYLSVAPGANYALTPDDIDDHAGAIRSAALVVMQMEIRPDTIRRALAIASEAAVPVLFNYAPARDAAVEISPAMTGVVVNEAEAEQLTGSSVIDLDTARGAARLLLARGPKFAVVTLGANGAVGVSADVDTHVPGRKVTAVDTTAAGDTFCGSLAVALVEGLPLPDAMRFAIAASALACTKVGAQPSIPSRTEVESIL